VFYFHDNIPLGCQEDDFWNCQPLVQFLCKINSISFVASTLITISFDFFGFVKYKILGVVECGVRSYAILLSLV